MSILVKMFSYKYALSVYLLCLASVLRVMLGREEKWNGGKKQKTAPELGLRS